MLQIHIHSYTFQTFYSDILLRHFIQTLYKLRAKVYLSCVSNSDIYFEYVDIVMLTRPRQILDVDRTRKHMLDASNLAQMYVQIYRACGLRLHGRRNGSDRVGEENGKNGYRCYGQDRRPRYASLTHPLLSGGQLRSEPCKLPPQNLSPCESDSPSRITNPSPPHPFHAPANSSRRGPFATKIVGSSRFSSDTAVMQVGISWTIVPHDRNSRGTRLSSGTNFERADLKIQMGSES